MSTLKKYAAITWAKAKAGKQSLNFFLHANGYRYKLNDKSPRQTWQALYRSLLSY